MNKVLKITLGTAQLGMKYGIANVNGKPDFETAIKILKYSWTHGIKSFDTAPDYGNSEQIIGSFIKTLSLIERKNAIISTKLPKLETEDFKFFEEIYKKIKNQVLKSIENLCIQKIPIYLVHHAPDLFLKNEMVIDCLNQLKKENLIENFGVSCYKPEEIKKIINYKEINVVQVPINIFDQRLIHSGLLEELNKKKILIFGRSIFLQGLFFIPLKKLPSSLKIAKKPLLKLRRIARDNHIEIVKLALLFIRDIPEITSLVIGAENIKQIKNNLKILNEKPISFKINRELRESFSNLPEELINPSLWKV